MFTDLDMFLVKTKEDNISSNNDFTEEKAGQHSVEVG